MICTITVGKQCHGNDKFGSMGSAWPDAVLTRCSVPGNMNRTDACRASPRRTHDKQVAEIASTGVSSSGGPHQEHILISLVYKVINIEEGKEYGPWAQGIRVEAYGLHTTGPLP